VKRHDLDLFSLVFGTLFALLGGLFLLDRIDATHIDLRWLGPLPLIGLGLAIVVLAARSDRRAE
jgi:hypothetical protein